MPAYNAGKYIEEAIQSILTQTYSSFEYIIINDGSTDNTEAIIKSFKDERIVYINNQSNLGLIESLNKGILISKGTYIARMDADDVAMPDRLSEQLKTFNRCPAAVAIGTNYFVLNGNLLKLAKNEDDSDYLKSLLLFATCFCHPTVMIKNIFSKDGIAYHHDFIHAEDYKLWTDLALHGELRNTDKPLLKYRSHPKQISVSHNESQLQISSRIRQEYMQALGFVYTGEQFEIHNAIGNNEFIKSKEQLSQIEEWLSELIKQNKAKRKFNESSFNKAIHKFWLDSCGNTCLGLWAYRSYFASGISKTVSLKLKQKLILFGKCTLRAFKS